MQGSLHSGINDAIRRERKDIATLPQYKELKSKAKPIVVRNFGPQNETIVANDHEYIDKNKGVVLSPAQIEKSLIKNASNGTYVPNYGDGFMSNLGAAAAGDTQKIKIKIKIKKEKAKKKLRRKKKRYK